MDLRLHADSADVPAVADLLHEGLVRGVTTNPTLLARAGRTSADLPELARLWHDQGAEEIFFQAVGRSTAELVEAGNVIADLGAVVKVPATRAGFAAARQLADLHIPTLVTAVYTVPQVIMAASIGVTYVAPYLGRLTDSGVDGLELIARMHDAVARTETRVLVASVRSPADVEALVGIGVCDITAAPQVWLDSVADAASERAAEQFLSDAGYEPAAS